jgi:hypothetical protein
MDRDSAADSVEDSWDGQRVDCGALSGCGDFGYREGCGEL